MITNLARPEILAMKAYQSARWETSDGLLLNANENPNDAWEYNRYPEQQPEQLVYSLSELYKVDPENLLVTRGSDEGIDLLIRTFCRPYKDKVMICPPTYGMYQVSAEVNATTVLKVPLTEEFELNTELMLQKWRPAIKLVFVCNPNNPTGNIIPQVEILALCEALKDNAIVVVDEAYIEYSCCKSVSTYLQQYPNLVVLRTLSKAYGLAGVRCGAVLANPMVIDLLRKVIAPYPVSACVEEVVCERLENKSKVDSEIKQTSVERDRLMKFLNQLAWVQAVYASSTNFILTKVNNAGEIMEYCRKQKILIRDRNSCYLPGCVRISIGTSAQNQQLMEVLANV